MIITFCGHSNCNDKEVEKWLIEVIEEHIILGATTFYLGSYGDFDNMCATTCTKLKIKYPYIERVLVIPYINRSFNTAKYDNSYYPELESVPKRFAISKRNEIMIDEADIIISYVLHDIGSGAYKTLEYAKRKKKLIINYPNKIIIETRT